MSSGGGAAGETRYNWNDDMAPRWNNLLNSAMWQGFTQNSDGSMTPRDRESYTGERFAPIQYDQYAAGENIRSLNDLSTGTIQAGNAARGEIQKTLGGEYLGKNPFASQQASNANPYIGGNQFMDQTTSTDRNAFAGDNPYLRSVMGQGLDDLTGAYQRGTAADTTRMFNMAGAFGGSAHQNAVANNEAGLGKTLNNYVSGMLNQQYDRSAGLEDSFLNRDLQNQQGNASRQSGLMENQLNRGFQNYNSALDRGAGAYEGERGRMMGAVGQGQAEQGMALQRAGAQMGVGEMYQNQGQKTNDFNFDQWTQAKNHPYSMLQMLSGLYGQAQGGGGMNQTLYQNGSSSAPWLGAALMGASMFGGK